MQESDSQDGALMSNAAGVQKEDQLLPCFSVFKKHALRNFGARNKSLLTEQLAWILLWIFLEPTEVLNTNKSLQNPPFLGLLDV